MAKPRPPVDGPASASNQPAVLAWLDRSEYPFESNYGETEYGQLHYVDEGTGRPLVMLHGNPTWSFVNRHLIRGLSDEYRCIAPDLLGFGLSEKPREFPYRVRDHAVVLDRFLADLDLTDATLFLQDWGGPTGAYYASRHPDTVDSFVVMNTALWPMTDATHVRAFSRFMQTPLAGLLNRQFDVPAQVLMPLAFGDRSRWTATLRHHYGKPMESPVAREAALTFTRELLGATPFLSELWNHRDRFANTPALLCWGMEGPLFRSAALGRCQALFPEARTVEFPTVGHFVQEEQPEKLLREVREFLRHRDDT